MAPVVPTASSGCTETSKRTRAATLRGLASAFSGSSSKPEQPEPPPYAAALPTAWNPDGVRGNRRFCDSPGRSLVLSRERESTRLNKRQATKKKTPKRANRRSPVNLHPKPNKMHGPLHGSILRLTPGSIDARHPAHLASLVPQRVGHAANRAVAGAGYFIYSSS